MTAAASKPKPTSELVSCYQFMPENALLDAKEHVELAIMELRALLALAASEEFEGWEEDTRRGVLHIAGGIAEKSKTCLDLATAIEALEGAGRSQGKKEGAS